MNNTQNQWDIKFLKEYPFMPFGSLMNAWATINQGKDMSLDEFLADAQKIFELATKLVESRAQEVKINNDEPEF